MSPALRYGRGVARCCGCLSGLCGELRAARGRARLSARQVPVPLTCPTSRTENWKKTNQNNTGWEQRISRNGGVCLKWEEIE